MPKLDLTLLGAAGAGDPAKPGARTEFRSAFNEAQSFNLDYKDDHSYTEEQEFTQVKRLDKVLELAGTWLTSKPPKRGQNVAAEKAQKNAARWEALAKLCEKCSAELIAMGYRPLSGHWSSDPVSDPGDHPNYWLERLDPQHRGAAMLKDRYTKWAQSGGSTQSFFDFVNSDRTAPQMGVRYDKGTDQAQAQERRTRRRQSQIMIEAGGLHRMNDVGTSAGIYDTVAANLKTEFAGPGYAIFVWDHKKRIFSGLHIANSLHHSTPRGGRPVRCAGEFRTDNQGKIVMITSKTGHYTTTDKEFKVFLTFLKDKGVIRNDAFCVPDTTGQAKDSWPVYRALEYVNGGGQRQSKAGVLTVSPALDTDMKSRNFWLRLQT